MASVNKRTRSDGTHSWAVRYRIDGRDSSTTFPTEREANYFAAQINVKGIHKALSESNLSTAPTRNNPTVIRMVEKYIAQLSGVKPDTPRKYRSILHADIEPYFGRMRVADLDHAAVKAWLEWLRTTKKNSAKTQKNKLAVLAAGCGLALENGFISRMPTRRVRIAPTIRKKEPVFLNEDELSIVLSAVDEHYQQFVLFLAASGCRFSEATALQPRHVDRTTGEVSIVQAFVGDGNYGYELGVPKTQRSRRVIKVDPELIAELDYDDADEFVFTNRQGGPIRQSTFINNTWVRATRDMDLPDHRKPRLHDLRHTCASRMLADGKRIEMVSRHLGHSTIKTTVDIYGHLADVDRAPAPVSAHLLARARRRQIRLVKLEEQA